MSSSFSSSSVCLECPVCLQIPRKEIYQCINGHSVCEPCISQLETCPSCRVSISGSINTKVRNYYAETLLDIMKFSCIWKKQGCQEMKHRGELSDHYTVCKYGTTNLCSYEGYEQCGFQFSTISLNQPERLNEVMDHFKSEHDVSVIKMQWGRFWNMQLENETFADILKLPDPQTALEAQFFEVVDSQQANSENPKKDIFILFINFEEDKNKQKLFTFAFGMLTSETVDKELSFKVEVCIKGQPKSEISNKWGENYVPDIKWTMIPMDAPKIKMFYKMATMKHPSFPFSIPISHLQKHYLDKNDKLNITFAFHKE